MNKDAFVVAEISEFVRFYLVLFSFGIVDVAFAGAEAPGAFDDASFADEVGSLDGVGFISRAEDHAVAEIEGEDF